MEFRETSFFNSILLTDPDSGVDSSLGESGVATNYWYFRWGRYCSDFLMVIIAEVVFIENGTG